MSKEQTVKLPVNWTPLPGWTTNDRGVYFCVQCACIFADEDRIGVCDTCGEAICPNCECGCEYDNAPAEQRIAELAGLPAREG